MSDFGSLLNQFQRDAKQLTEKKKKPAPSRSADDGIEDEIGSRSSSTTAAASRKRARRSLDAATFPPVHQVICICPAGVQTGGPEALHQLCHQIRRAGASNNGVEAFMFYVRSSAGRRHVTHTPGAQQPAIYQELYQAPVLTDWDPLTEHPAAQDRLLVWPECWTDEMLDYLNTSTCSSSKPSPCAIWWLSVNNNMQKFQEWHRRDIVHLHQSEYARQYLLQKGATYVYPMTEYISCPLVPLPCRERTIDVLYNPLKGIHYTDAIRLRSEQPSGAGRVTFRPIGGGLDGRERISPSQVRSLLVKAKVYIDFGPHPGMDRLPREAALAGCVVITNRQGAAGFEEDVPLPAKYKLHEFNVDAIDRLLKDVLEHFEERTKDLDDYREWIRSQPGRMEQCVLNLLNEIVTKRKI